MTARDVYRIVDFTGRHVRDVERPVLFTEAGKPVPFPSGAVHPARTSVADMRAAKIDLALENRQLRNAVETRMPARPTEGR